MPNTVITTTATRIDAVFNDDESKVGFPQGSWKKSTVHRVEDRDSYFEVYVNGGHRWTVRSSETTYASALLIDSIDGTTITTHAGLYTELKGLII